MIEPSRDRHVRYAILVDLRTGKISSVRLPDDIYAENAIACQCPICTEARQLINARVSAITKTEV